jgi:GTP-binding protein YchF
MIKIGIVGLPNVGKTTLFNALTHSNALVANYPFTTIDPHIGVISVPDERFDEIAKYISSKKYTKPIIEIVDIAGLVKGASKGEGLGNQFLSHIRDVDAIIHVIRYFHDENVSHIYGNVEPIRDIEIIKSELALADLTFLERKQKELAKAAKSNEKNAIAELEFVTKIISFIEKGVSIDVSSYNDEEKKLLKSYNILSAKPVLYVLNISENDIAKNISIKIEDEVIPICAKLEYELTLLPEKEQQEFLSSYGIESKVNEIIRKAYKLLDIITFYTANENEMKAWTIPKGTKVIHAAGKVHSDMEKGFIKAEVISYKELIEAKSISAAKEKGWMRIEGKDYIVQDGDILYFRFQG